MQTITTLKDLEKEFDQISKSNVGYMDIETTGLSAEHNSVTLIGLHSIDATSVYIDTQNHKKACNDIDACNYLVTFNGNRFDIPFIDKHYGLKQEFKSIDLMYLFWQLGYKGGLKKIEQDLGLSRMQEVEGMKGKDAVTLWHKYKAGCKDSLNKLVHYNFEDIVNLEILFNYALQRSLGNQIPLQTLKQDKLNITQRIKEKDCFYVWN
jgi:hypothetical protein